jgi:hypothetical protein
VANAQVAAQCTVSDATEFATAMTTCAVVSLEDDIELESSVPVSSGVREVQGNGFSISGESQLLALAAHHRCLSGLTVCVLFFCCC